MKSSTQAMEIFLQPGELWFGEEDTRIRTILGSCVAVTLWHPVRRIGGMCHYMLPKRPSQCNGRAARDGRYGDEALEILRDEICASGSHPGEYTVKLFGGGRMFQTSNSASSVPDQNVAAARALAARHGLRVTAEHLGGHGHRYVVLDLENGNTWLKHSPLKSEEDSSLPCLVAQPYATLPLASYHSALSQ